ncbi:hypothetical protein T492DRAFT_1071774 [Pavlovales sp. CCMP2436]|nr:hypothetical protein T492DRAFT_1071774 [Pavlovales sp. CCMP2436]
MRQPMPVLSRARLLLLLLAGALARATPRTPVLPTIGSASRPPVPGLGGGGGWRVPVSASTLSVVYAPTARRPCVGAPRWRGGGASMSAAAPLFAKVASIYKIASIQKVLELGTIAAFGTLTRNRLDSGALTALLLKAVVPAVILTSLAGLSLSRELSGFLGAGALLVLCQIAVGQLVARVILGGSARRAVTRRTVAVQLATMAPVLSSFAFISEFAPARLGLAAIVDLPSKAFTLLFLPLFLGLLGQRPKICDQAGSLNDQKFESPPPGTGARLRAQLGALCTELSDPFNAAIVAGLLMAATGTKVADLGFVGGAMRTLASAQTPILFLLIGTKFSLSGARPTLVLSLLFARHGLIALATAAFLRFAGVTDAGARLAAVLSSQAASSIVGFGQLDRMAARRSDLGYDPALAFEIVGLSFPLTIVLNTVTCIAGAAYVDHLPLVGAGLLAISAAIYAAKRAQIDAAV